MNGAAGQPRSFDPLDRLLNAQSYRLAHWRVASEEINYRRFFDVNELAALRMEDPVVFDEVHRFAFELVRRGAVTGLRIDHVDGLFAPGDYLRRLQRALLPPATRDPFFIVVEKILGAGRAAARATGRCTAPPATSSAPSSTTCSSTAATSAPSTISTAASCSDAAAVVRRSRLPQQEAGAARDHVGRHQLAGPPAQSLLRAQPALPRLHALQPDLDAEGSDRLVSRSTGPTSRPTSR